jgi:NADPH-dependent 2,4-dienoyl-CoA reductase/sulfur reductase-like enzyme
MSHIVVLGAGIAGTSGAFELRGTLPKDHRITLINPIRSFQFVPSNPWVAVGWRTGKQTTAALGTQLARKHIDLVEGVAEAVDPERNLVRLADGRAVEYDYLVLTTGPELAFDEIPGLGPDAGHTVSICTLAHARHAWDEYRRFLESPGPIVVGAVQGASCFGPAYEFALILDADLRKRRLRDKVPMTFVTSEPYIGHMGLGGVGDSKGLMESLESMVTAIAHNIRAEIEGREPTAKATWNAICLADMGDTGIAFVALPQMPPRNVTWARKGKWVHLAKVAFEKYFLHKVRHATAETIYERYVLKALGIEKLKAS